MKFGIFYELQLPRPWERGRRAQALSERARPGRARRPARLRLRLGGRAPLPRGVLALARAGVLPRRRQPAHQEHPPRPRHLPAHHQPSRPRRRARRHARPALATAAASSAWARAPRSPSSSRSAATWRTSARCWRRPCRRSSRCSRTAAASITASTSTSRCATCVPKPLQKPHPPLWVACSQLDTIERAGALRHGRARLPVRQRRRGARLGARLLQRHHQAAEEARRLRRPTPTSRWSASSCAPRPTRRRARAPTAPRSSSSRCASTAPRPNRQAPGARHGQHVGRVQQVEARQPGSAGGGAARRPDRLARDASARSCAKFETSHIDQVILLNQAGKNTPRAHLRVARAVRQGGDAGVPGPTTRARGLEGRGAGGEIELEEIDTAAFKDRYGKLAVSVAPAPKVAAG